MSPLLDSTPEDGLIAAWAAGAVESIAEAAREGGMRDLRFG